MRFARLEAEIGPHTHGNVQWTQHLTHRMIATGTIFHQMSGLATCNPQTNDSTDQLETPTMIWRMARP
jgi:hypothetical protein